MSSVNTSIRPIFALQQTFYKEWSADSQAACYSGPVAIFSFDHLCQASAKSQFTYCSTSGVEDPNYQEDFPKDVENILKMENEDYESVAKRNSKSIDAEESVGVKSNTYSNLTDLLRQLEEDLETSCRYDSSDIGSKFMFS